MLSALPAAVLALSRCFKSPDPQAAEAQAVPKFLTLLWDMLGRGRHARLLQTILRTSKLQRFIRGTDTGLVSLGEAHRFGVAESLAILMIFRELRDITKSVE